MISAILLPVLALAVAPPERAVQPGTTQGRTSPLRIVETWPVGGDGGWDYLCVDATARRLYLPRGTHTMILDTETGTSIGDIPDTAGVHGVTLAPELDKGFTSNGRASTVTVFALTTLKPVETVSVGRNPDAILYEPTTKRVFVFNGQSHDATVVDAATLKVIGTIDLGGKPEFGVHDGSGKVFVNIEDTSEVARLDAKDMKVETRFTLAPGQGPSGLAIDPAHRRLFSVCSNQKMVVLDADTGKVLATPAIGKGVDGAAFDAAGSLALASNGEGTLTVVSTADDHFEVVQTLATAARARTLTIDPATRRVYLPTADVETPPPAEPGKEGGNRRSTMKPGSFRIIVAAP